MNKDEAAHVLNQACNPDNPTPTTTLIFDSPRAMYNARLRLYITRANEIKALRRNGQDALAEFHEWRALEIRAKAREDGKYTLEIENHDHEAWERPYQIITGTTPPSQ